MLEKAWFPWIWIVLGNVFVTSTWRGAYRNCWLTECEWNSISKIIFGILAVIFVFIYWRRKNNGDGESSLIMGLLTSAAFLAAIHLIFNGLGLVGPSLCPEYNNNCGARRSFF